MSTITLTATLLDVNGDPADATTVTATAMPPNQTFTADNPTLINLTPIGHPSVGVYTAQVDANLPGSWQVRFVGTGGNEITVDQVFTVPAYATTSELRSELGNPPDLDDMKAMRILTDTEELIDSELGIWPVDPATARKMIPGYCENWQWTKLGRATVKLAARLYNDPSIIERQYRKLSGPDFSREDPIGGSVFGDEVDSLLNHTGLRRLTTQISRGLGRGGGRPPWYDFSHNDTSWDAPIAGPIGAIQSGRPGGN